MGVSTGNGQLGSQVEVERLRRQVYSQDIRIELGRLLERLNLPRSTPIEAVKTESLPKTTSLKVYLYTGGSVKVERAFRREIEEWNTKDSQRYGRLEIVGDLTQAELILARYVEFASAVEAWPIRLAPGYSYLVLLKPDGLKVIYRFADLVSAYDDAPPRCLACERLFKLMKTGAKG